MTPGTAGSRRPNSTIGCAPRSRSPIPASRSSRPEGDRREVARHEGQAQEGEYQKVWGADLFGQVSQGDFLVREPVNPDPDRVCIAASDPTDFGPSLMTAKGKSAVRLQGVATPWFRCGGARGGAVRRSILADTIRCHAGHPWCGQPARWCAGQRGPCGVGVRRRVRRRRVWAPVVRWCWPSFLRRWRRGIGCMPDVRRRILSCGGHRKVCSYDYGKDEERPSRNTGAIL